MVGAWPCALPCVSGGEEEESPSPHQTSEPGGVRAHLSTTLQESAWSSTGSSSPPNNSRDNFGMPLWGLCRWVGVCLCSPRSHARGGAAAGLPAPRRGF